MIPTGDLGVQVLVRAWVPIDDEHTMFWNIALPASMSEGQGGPGTGRRSAPQADGTTSFSTRGTLEFLPDSTDWLGRARITQTKDNDYLIDREEQASGRSYTGIPGIFQQDQAVTESMGAIYDRTHEHLGTSDAMVIRTRRRLINAAKALRDHGIVPAAVDNAQLYRIRSGGVILPRSADWIEATRELQRPTVPLGAPAVSARSF
jgi:hypothetical protein